MSLVKPLISYKFFEDIIKFIRKYWNMRKVFYPGYFFSYPRLIQSLKLRFDYVIISNNKRRKNKNIDVLLDRFFESLESSFRCEFPRYIIKVSENKGSFYVLVKKPRGKILGTCKLVRSYCNYHYHFLAVKKRLLI